MWGFKKLRFKTLSRMCLKMWQAVGLEFCGLKCGNLLLFHEFLWCAVCLPTVPVTELSMSKQQNMQQVRQRTSLADRQPSRKCHFSQQECWQFDNHPPLTLAGSNSVATTRRLKIIKQPNCWPDGNQSCATINTLLSESSLLTQNSNKNRDQ